MTAKPGTRIRLIHCTDPHTRLRWGLQGTVQFVDSLGTVHVLWDDGSTLGLIPGEDTWQEMPRLQLDRDRSDTPDVYLVIGGNAIWTDGLGDEFYSAPLAPDGTILWDDAADIIDWADLHGPFIRRTLRLLQEQRRMTA